MLTCNHNAGEAKPGRFLELTGRPGEVSELQVKNNKGKSGGRQLQMPTLGLHMCVHTHTPYHTTSYIHPMKGKEEEKKHKLNVVKHSCNLRTWEVEMRIWSLSSAWAP